MARILHLILFLVICVSSLAQSGIRDSIKDALRSEPTYILSLNNRTSFVNANRVTTYGLQFGLDYNRSLKLYSSFYFQSNRNRKWLYHDPRFKSDTVLRSGKLGYLSVGIEPTVHRNKRFKVSTPAQIGFGLLNNIYAVEGHKIDRNSKVIIPLEYGLNTSYQLFQLLHLRAGLGYRLMIGQEEVVRLSAPYYNLGLTVPLKPLYETLSN